MGIKIVVGYDFSEISDIALTEALQHAARQPGSVLHVLTALDDRHASAFPGIEATYQGAEELQERLGTVVKSRVEQMHPEGLMFFLHVRIGDPADELLTLAGEADADVVCVGTHGRGGVKRLILGSVAEKVVRHAHCPVLVARVKDHDAAFMQGLSPEPPCPRCVERRAQTGGAEWWCEAHAKPYVPPHRYSYEQKIAIMQPDHQPLS